jgi:hypothetical protein
LCLLCTICNAPYMVLIIVLVLAGWVAASVVVAALASTVFRGARIGPETITLPPEYIDLTDPATRNVSCSADLPGTEPSR